MTEQKDIHIDPVEEQVFDSFQLDDVNYETILTEKFKHRKTFQEPDPKKILAFIPGKIKKVHVKKKSKVKEGDILLVLEAMKMNNNIFSPMKGTIKEVYVTAGLSVSKGALLVEFK
ncbi:MAG: acetyl-CoA carboxylase biotin carboxyl carrier protein subunit [Bacteroidales bacterium]|nr:acetyl-CoA carboxylase biotin carboxyl carrier protein subunit [Bacteroidales bacterium]